MKSAEIWQPVLLRFHVATPKEEGSLSDLSALLPVIQALEVQLHHPVLRLDAKRVEKLQHKDSEEIGHSGPCYSKSQTIAALKMESHRPQIFSECALR